MNSAHSICCIKGCDKPHYARGCCQLHWRRLNDGLALDGDQPPRRNWKSFVVGESREFADRKVGKQARVRGVDLGYRFKTLKIPAGVRVTRIE